MGGSVSAHVERRVEQKVLVGQAGRRNSPSTAYRSHCLQGPKFCASVLELDCLAAVIAPAIEQRPPESFVEKHLRLMRVADERQIF